MISRLDQTLLTNVVAFARLETIQIREILDQALPRRFNAGATVFNAGDAADHFFLLLDGHIRVVRITQNGEQIIALHIPAGQLFGIAHAIGHDEYPATAIAADECLALAWPSRLWKDFVATYDGFGEEVSKSLGRRMTEIHDKAVELATLQVQQRIANALLRLINQSGKTTADGIEIDFPITRQDLSEITGSTLHTVSRVLSQWEKDGLVKSARKKIVVTDAHSLVVIGSGQPQP